MLKQEHGRWAPRGDQTGEAYSCAHRKSGSPGRSLMRTNIGVVHKDADSAFGFHFPTFPAADEMDDLPSKASEALSLLPSR